MQANTEQFNEIRSFNFFMSYLELDSESKQNAYDSHIHSECEIYINVSGDVSFVVENRIYPIKKGDIIITRPFEYHHCIYHSNKIHKHFWCLFSPKENEFLLDAFFDRKSGEANHLTLSPEDTEALIAHCHKMTKPEKSEYKKYYNFFKLINFLQNADVADVTEHTYPPDVVYAVNYINENFADAVSVHTIAKSANVSINTLERHFRQMMGSSPSEYLKKKRLANAVKLLAEDCSVTEASERSGFSDYSGFISLFKQTYGTTPLKYKKSLIS